MDSERNLLAALLAVQSDMVSLDDVKTLFPWWQANGHGAFIDWLAERGKLAAGDRPHLEYLVLRRLERHEGNARAALKSIVPDGDWQSLTRGQMTTLSGQPRPQKPARAVAPADVARPVAEQPQARRRFLVAGIVGLALAVVAGAAIPFLPFTSPDPQPEPSVSPQAEQPQTEVKVQRVQHQVCNSQKALVQFADTVSANPLLNRPEHRELLLAARSCYADLARTSAADPEGQPLLAQTLLRLGAIQSQLGDADAATTLEQARAAYQKLTTDEPSKDVFQEGLVRSHLALGRLLFSQKGATPQAETHLAKACALANDLVQNHPTTERRKDLAAAHDSLAELLSQTLASADPAGKPALWRRIETDRQAALDIWQKLANEDAADPARRLDLAKGCIRLAGLYEIGRDTERIEALLEQALGEAKKLADADPKHPEYQAALARVFHFAGTAARDLGNSADAETAFRQASKHREKLGRLAGLDLRTRLDLAQDYCELGNLRHSRSLKVKGDDQLKARAQAKEYYQRGLTLYEQLAEDHGSDQRLWTGWGALLCAMGEACLQETDAAALPWFDQAIAKLELAVGKEAEAPPAEQALSRALAGRAKGRTQEGELASALADWDRALELAKGKQRAEYLDGRRQTRLRHALTLVAKKADFQAASSEVAKVTAERLTPAEKIAAAHLLSECARLAEEQKSPLADKVAAQAVSLLRQAKSDGFFDQNLKGVELLDVFRQIAPLARRVDFQDLLREFTKTER